MPKAYKEELLRRTVALTARQWRILEAHSERTGVPLAELLRRAVDAGMAQVGIEGEAHDNG